MPIASSQRSDTRSRPDPSVASRKKQDKTMSSAGAERPFKEIDEERRMRTLGKLRLAPVTDGVCLINTACPWATDSDELENLYAEPATSAVTTRTAVVGSEENSDRLMTVTFAEDPAVHKVAFIKDTLKRDDGRHSSHARGSLNSYGYSPRSLSYYLLVIREIYTRSSRSELPLKPFIISITGAPHHLGTAIQALRQWCLQLQQHEGVPDIAIETLVAIEVNTSCPNIQGTTEPPGYNLHVLRELLRVVKQGNEPATSPGPVLSIGFKMPPYIYEAQFVNFIALLEHTPSIDFVTCTNTLGQCFWYDADEAAALHPSLPVDAPAGVLGFGGMAGESLHALSLGNVLRMRSLLTASTVREVRNIQIIGVGGVTSGLAARRHREAGASVVGLATALGREGIDVFERIAGELDVWVAMQESDREAEVESWRARKAAVRQQARDARRFG